MSRAGRGRDTKAIDRRSCPHIFYTCSSRENLLNGQQLHDAPRLLLVPDAVIHLCVFGSLISAAITASRARSAEGVPKRVARAPTQ